MRPEVTLTIGILACGGIYWFQLKVIVIKKRFFPRKVETILSNLCSLVKRLFDYAIIARMIPEHLGMRVRNSFDRMRYFFKSPGELSFEALEYGQVLTVQYRNLMQEHGVTLLVNNTDTQYFEERTIMRVIDGLGRNLRATWRYVEDPENDAVENSLQIEDFMRYQTVSVELYHDHIAGNPNIGGEYNVGNKRMFFQKAIPFMKSAMNPRLDRDGKMEELQELIKTNSGGNILNVDGPESARVYLASAVGAPTHEIVL